MSGRLVVISMAVGCSHSAPPSPGPTTSSPAKIQLAVLPAESDVFPRAARAISSSLAAAQVAGVDETTISKVSLEVVQLSIECVERTPACYSAVGKSVGAHQILFAELDEGPKKQSIKVTVTLFDVDAGKRTKAAIKVFPSEEDVAWGVADVVSEATKP
jgi:hypothetical protein